MKDIKTYIIEHLIEEADDAKVKELEKKLDKVEDKAEDAEKRADDAEKQAKDAEKQADDAAKEADKAEESIKDEKSFRDYAKTKFEAVFGKDKVDEKKMKEIVDGILSKYGDGDNTDWGKCVGVLNKSFGH